MSFSYLKPMNEEKKLQYFIQRYREKNTEFLLLGLVTFMGFILRFYTIGARSLWMDELRQASYYYSESIYHLTLNAASQAQPPLDYAIGYYLFSFLDISEVAVRFPALIFGTSVIVVTFYLARRLFSVEVAILAALFTCLSKYLIEYSQEARPYSIFFLFLLLTMLIYLKAITANKRWLWVLFGFSLYGMLLTRGFEPLVVVISLNILTLVAFIINRALSGGTGIFTGKNALLTVIISLMVLIAYAPFFYIIFQSSKGYVSDPFHFSLFSYFDTLRHFPIKRVAEHFCALTSPLTVFFLFFFTMGIVSIIRQGRNRSAGLFFLVLVLFIPFLHTFIQYEKNLPVFLRYSIYYLPFLYIVTSVGIVHFARLIAKRFNPSELIAPILMVLIVTPVIVINGFTLSHYYKSSEKTDWRGASQYLMHTLKKDDIILTESLAGYGDWNPGFLGRWFYFKGTNRDFEIYGLTDTILTNPYRKGNVLLLLMDYPWGKEPGGADEMVEETTFTNLSVIRLKKPYALLVDNLLTLLPALVKLMPNDSSRVDLYINQAKLYYLSGRKDLARAAFGNARVLVPEQKRGIFDKRTQLFYRILQKG